MIIFEKMKFFYQKIRKDSLTNKFGLTSKINHENIYGNLNENFTSALSRRMLKRNTLVRTPDKLNLPRSEHLRSPLTQHRLSDHIQIQDYNINAKKLNSSKYSFLLKRQARIGRDRNLYKRRNWNELQVLFHKKGKERCYSQTDIHPHSIFELKGMKILIVRKNHILINSEPSKRPIKVDKGQRIKTSYKSCEHTKIPRLLTISEEFKVMRPHKASNLLKEGKSSTSRIHLSVNGCLVNRTLLIIQFDGVIGDFNPSLFCQSQLLSFQANTCSMLMPLSKKYHIAILFKCIREKAEFALKHLGKLGIRVDGSYVVIQNPWSNLPVNYEKIYKDFNIESEQVASKVIIVGSLDSEELILNNPQIKLKDIINSVPIVLDKSLYKKIPLVILIKHKRLNTSISSLNSLNELLINLVNSKYNPQNIEESEMKEWRVITTCDIQEHYINESKQKVLIATNRKKEYPVKSVYNNRVIRDVRINAKYIDLTICNENIKKHVNDYLVSVNSRNWSKKIERSEIDMHKPVYHKLILIN